MPNKINLQKTSHRVLNSLGHVRALSSLWFEQISLMLLNIEAFYEHKGCVLESQRIFFVSKRN